MAEGPNLIGVDIGSSAIKLCEIKDGRAGSRGLVRYGYHPLPPQCIVDGHVMDSGAIVDGLEKLFHKSKKRDVALRISGHSVIIKKITMPIMTASELAEQITWEAEQYIPFDLDDVQIDHQVLHRREAQGQMDVLLVAAKKEEIGDLTNLALEAKLRPKVVDLDAFCMQNCYEAGYGEPSASQTIVLLDIGAALTTLNILAGGTTAFTRDILSGGNAITEEVQRQLSVSFEEAESFKCGTAVGLVPPKVPEILQQGVDTLAGEIQRSLDFYLATSGDREIQKIFVSGGTANIRTLVEAVERRSRVPVEVMDPLRVAAPDSRVIDPMELQGRTPQLAVSMGLGLRKEREKAA